MKWSIYLNDVKLVGDFKYCIISTCGIDLAEQFLGSGSKEITYPRVLMFQHLNDFLSIRYHARNSWNLTLL